MNPATGAVTGTALAPVPTSAQSLARAADERGDSLESLLRLAQHLVPTGFLPDHIKTPGQAVAIILAGREMGIGPMTALRGISLVKGKVTVSADLLLARFKAAGGRAQWRRDEATGATLVLTLPNGDRYTSSFTEQDARRAGLWGKAGPWQAYPRAMLRARAITAGLKALGWEPASGVYDGPSGELPDAPTLPETASGLRADVELALAPEVHEGPGGPEAASDPSAAEPADERAATEEQLAEIAALVAHPAVATWRGALERRIRKGLSAHEAATAIEAMRRSVRDAGDDPALPLADRRRPPPSAIAEGH